MTHCINLLAKNDGQLFQLEQVLHQQAPWQVLGPVERIAFSR
jgi:hypothetical protein